MIINTIKKKIKNLFFGNLLLLFSLSSSLFLISCSGKDSPSQSNEAVIKTLVLTVGTTDYSVSFIGTTGVNSNEFPFGTTEATIKTLTLSDNASSDATNKLTFVDNEATIKVTAQDSTEKIYTIRAKVKTFSNEAVIKTLVLTVGTTDYSVSFTGTTGVNDDEFPFGTTEATIKTLTLSDNASSDATNKLTFVNNEATIKVTAQDSTEKIYTIRAKVETPSNEAVIKTLILTVETIDYPITFTGTTGVNDDEFPFGTTEATIKTLTLSDDASSDAADKLTFVNNEATIKVTAQDSSEDIYTIKIITKAKVSFETYEGTVIEAIEVTKGVALGNTNKPNDPTKVSHIFRGWYSDSSLTQDFDFETTVVDQDQLTLYAKWEIQITGQSYTETMNIGQAPKDAVFADDETVITLQGVPNGVITLHLGTTTTQEVTVTNEEIQITKADIGSIINDLAIDEILNISITLSGITSNTVTFTYIPSNIYTWKDLQAIRQGLTSDYILINDIILPDAGTNGMPTQGFAPIKGANPASLAGQYTGVFNGDGHLIKNFFFNRPNESYAGLFGSVGNGGEVIDVGLEIASTGITGSAKTGGLVGLKKDSGRVIGYVVGGPVKGLGNRGVGGLVGELIVGNGDTNLAMGYSTVSVEGGIGSSNIGGLVGVSNALSGSPSIIGYATGSVKASSAVGGLVGGVARTSIKGYATGNVTGTTTSDKLMIGGLIGTYLSPYYGYARGNVIRDERSNATKNIGLLAGVIPDAGAYYHSAKSDESQLVGITSDNRIDDYLDGTSIDAATATQASFEETDNAFTFGSGQGEWTYEAGKWPIINLVYADGTTPKIFQELVQPVDPATRP